MLKSNWINKIKSVDIVTIGGYTYEQVMDNKNCSKNPKYWFVINSTRYNENPKYLFKSKTAESWEYFDPEIVNPIRNTNQIYIRFLKVDEFVKPSNNFRKHGRYTEEGDETIAYEQYWDNLENKIDNGFEVDGVKITGRHFFTINFGRFRAIPVDEYGRATSSRKVWTFLKFLDSQFYLFHELEECALGGIYTSLKKFLAWFPLKTEDDFSMLTLQSFLLAKGRRKGWTANIAVGIFNYNFTFLESSMNILAAYEKAHYGPMLKAIATTKTFLDKNTPWIRITDIKGTREHFIAGINTKDMYGVPIQEGYRSEVRAESFKDNPFKGIGDTADVINIEEAGKFDKLLETFPISIEPLIRDGEILTGMAILGGTAGDMESGGSIGLATMMEKPSAYGCKEYDNIYEATEQTTVSGWFIDDLWYAPLRITKTQILELDDSERTQKLLEKFKTNIIDLSDAYGNSYRYFSELVLNKKRKLKRQTSVITYQKFLTQQPKYLSEAFLLNESSPFDVGTAKEALGILKVDEKSAAETGRFIIGASGIIKWNRDFSLNPVNEFPFKRDDTEGCWVLYQHPVKIKKLINTREEDKKKSIEEIASWRYLAATDPIDWGSGESSDDNKNKHSMAATYIIDSLTRNIVAEYIGRPRTSEDYFEQLWRGIDFYNGLLLYENNLKGLFSYFKTKNKLYLLANDPESLKDKVGYKQNNRMKGFHATAQVNAYGRELIHRWSLEEIPLVQDAEGEVSFIPRMFMIPSIGLLQEMIMWNSKGNFDRISSFGALMILLFDRDYDMDETETIRKSFGDTGIFKRVRQKLNKENPFKLNFPR